MRTLLVTTALLSMAAAGTADAQRTIAHGAGMARPQMMRPMSRSTTMSRSSSMSRVNVTSGNAVARANAVSRSRAISRVNVNRRGPRWGGRVDGRWWGGHRAPGGWGAYNRPVRGFALPGYWISPNWYISDWGGYGLPKPPVGYNWSRYYDDAVLIDGRGSVYDTIGGVDWDRYDSEDADYSYEDDGGYDEGAYADGGAPGAPYPYPGERRDSGLGGAAVGAVVGGVAGNVIAGRGNRLGGTLVGAGVGAAAGYAIDKAEDRGRRGPPPPRGYGAGYPPPPPMGHPHGGYPVTVHGTPGTTVTHTGAVPTPGYYADGYYFPGTSITTITFSSQPVVTTTKTYETVTYRSHGKRKAWRPARVSTNKAKCNCR